MNSGPRFGGSTTTPRHGSIGPGELREMPMRARSAAGSAERSCARLARSASMQAAMIASGPSATGV